MSTRKQNVQTFLGRECFCNDRATDKKKEKKNTKQDDQGQRNNKNKLLETSSKRTFKTASDITANCIWESKAALRESIDFYRCSHVCEH